MARSQYEYGTSPRKLQPEIPRKKQAKRKKLRVVEDLPRQDIHLSNLGCYWHIHIIINHKL